ncbi:MAG: hypothetical protein K2I52_05560, partial [Muribaculaceae bacterium]|nr:hypothetical protein [Muribaculaceae bacterium]
CIMVGFIMGMIYSRQNTRDKNPDNPDVQVEAGLSDAPKDSVIDTGVDDSNEINVNSDDHE